MRSVQASAGLPQSPPAPPVAASGLYTPLLPLPGASLPLPLLLPPLISPQQLIGLNLQSLFANGKLAVPLLAAGVPAAPVSPEPLCRPNRSASPESAAESAAAAAMAAAAASNVNMNANALLSSLLQNAAAAQNGGPLQQLVGKQPSPPGGVPTSVTGPVGPGGASAPSSGPPPSSARNTCKALKCPKCNWSYKYQETLEIHMREKHPDAEAQCVYCVSGQAHPRLARGESYSCGYKPFRCEVCNYSTTTKGNLSIHFQSDKHMNNLYELQKGAAVGSILASLGQSASAPRPPSSQQAAAATSSQSQSAFLPAASPPAMSLSPSVSPAKLLPAVKHEADAASELTVANAAASASSSDASLEPLASLKPHDALRRSISCAPNGSAATSGAIASSCSAGAASASHSSSNKSVWRCEYCNYETSVARNLRIHMTSEKHVHNAALAQQRQQLLASPSAAASAAATVSDGPKAAGVSGPAAGATQLMPEMLKQMFAILPNMSLLQSPFGRLDSSALAGNSALAASLQSMLAAHVSSAGLANNGSCEAIGALQEASAPDLQEDEEAEREREHEHSDHLFQCLVCEQFGCDSLDVLEAHVSRDRSKLAECSDAVHAMHTRLGVTGTQLPAPAAGGDGVRSLQVCRLCPYQTAIAANFQMHLKTEKHMQRLAHFNHMAEAVLADDVDEDAIARVEQRLEQLLRGGSTGDLAAGRITQVQCAACSLVANSLNKLHAHCCTREHSLLGELHAQLVGETLASDAPPATLACALCDWQAAGAPGACVRFLRHLQAAHWSQLAAKPDAELPLLEQWVVLEFGKSSRVESSRPVHIFSASTYY